MSIITLLLLLPFSLLLLLLVMVVVEGMVVNLDLCLWLRSCRLHNT